MKLVSRFRLLEAALVVAGTLLVTTVPALAQDYPPPLSFPSGQLDNLVSRIALYPDPLLAQIFAAASFPDQIRDAASWADQNRNLRGDDLANAMYQANLPFDPAVQALIPFPSVLDMLAADPNWTSELGNAFLADQGQVMDAVQRMRRTAEQYGYLQSNQQISVVDNGGGVAIEPVDPSLIYVPVYDPYVVYSRPRPGFYVGGAIGFRYGFSIGAFDRWGWGGGFNWSNHAVVVNHAPWGRTWYNRDNYVHNYGNWNRGQWRNTYSRPEVRTSGNYYRGSQYSNSYTNRSYDRGNSSQYNNRAYDRNTYDRGNTNQFTNRSNDRTSVAPVTPNSSYYRGNTNQFTNRSNDRTPVAPVTPNSSYYRGNTNQFTNPSNDRTPVAPVAPNRSYDRGNTNQFMNRNYDRTPAAPVTPNRNFDRGASNFANTNRSAAVPQSQGFGATRSHESGHFDRGFNERR